ncbi:MAG: GNAT family N-acetyltransferase [Deltaproteobacteria bacterium]|nr:GNAT family N-acetyltransferase [Deltaproteobacteria bacterium]
MNELRYVNLTEQFAPQCAKLELSSFPETVPADLIDEEDYRAYARIFPEGFFLCLDGDRVVGQGAGIFLDFDFDHPQHSIAGITGEHQCGNHDPDGDWYYGTDMVVNPDYRRRGIGKRLYELRKQVAREYNRKGIIAGGHIVGYADHKHQMSAAEYVDKVAKRELYDSTLTFQLENGFEVRGVLADYLEEPAIDNYAALIVWLNPDHRDGR